MSVVRYLASLVRLGQQSQQVKTFVSPRLRGEKLSAYFGQTALAALLVLLMVGCGETVPESSPRLQPLPTVAGAFSLPTATPGGLPTATADPTPPQAPLITPTPRERIAALPIYGDKLSRNWSAEQSYGMSYDLGAATPVYAGRAAIALTPTVDFGQLFFTVRPEADRVYPRERVMGLSLWLNSGDDYVGREDLALTVVGSNAYPYWQQDDSSVTIDERSSFSETRLYYLDINQDIPPHTWVELILWLDDLPAEPDYTYVTGVYLKSEQGFRRTIFIDEVNLLVVK